MITPSDLEKKLQTISLTNVSDLKSKIGRTRVVFSPKHGNTKDIRKKLFLERDVYKKLQYIYPTKYIEVATEIERRISNFVQKHPSLHRSNAPLFTEKDVMLICYADHVSSPNHVPLQTLRIFLKDYAKGLLNLVHLLPFYPFSSDDGFSVIDYKVVHPTFGTWDDIHGLAHDFGLMFDAVINHVSKSSYWFQEFLKGNQKYKNYFIAFDKEVDVSSVFRPRTHPLLTPFETVEGKKYVWTTFSDDQVDLNYANPDVFLEILDTFLFYIEQGAKVFRLDAIAYMWKTVGTSSIHLEQTHAVLQSYSEILHYIDPKLLIITETNVPHVDNISYFGDGENEANLVYNFALPPLLLYTFFNQNSTKLTKWAQTLEAPSSTTTFFNFTASHDGIGVTPVRDLITEEELKKMTDHVLKQGGKVNYRSREGMSPFPYELNIVYYNAIGSTDAFIASQAIMLALAGIPGIYFTSLFGGENWTEGVEKLEYNRAINRRKFDYKTLIDNLGDKTSQHHKVYSAYSRLLKVRTNETLFSPYSSQEILHLDDKIVAILRKNGTQSLLALTNISGQTVALSSEKLMNIFMQHQVNDILNVKLVNFKDQQDFTLQPYATAWLKAI